MESQKHGDRKSICGKLPPIFTLIYLYAKTIRAKSKWCGKLRSTIDEKMVPLIVMKGCQRIFCKQVGHINAVSVPYSLVNIKKKIYTFFVHGFSQDFSMYFGWKNSRHIHYEKAQKVD